MSVLKARFTPSLQVIERLTEVHRIVNDPKSWNAAPRSPFKSEKARPAKRRTR